MPIIQIQPGPATGQDTYIKGGAYQNLIFGFSPDLQLGQANEQWVFSLIRFVLL
ncbi:unnamed protein product, partial [marine sediment metagenome]